MNAAGDVAMGDRTLPQLEAWADPKTVESRSERLVQHQR
jgi:hypothetical protein